MGASRSALRGRLPPCRSPRAPRGAPPSAPPARSPRSPSREAHPPRRSRSRSPSAPARRGRSRTSRSPSPASARCARRRSWRSRRTSARATSPSRRGACDFDGPALAERAGRRAAGDPDPGTIDRCDDFSVAFHAIDRTRRALARYAHVVVLYPGFTNCAWGGRAGMPGAVVTSMPDANVLLHEIGHNIGLDHARSLECGASSGYAASFGRRCGGSEYGDLYDSMGGARRRLLGLGAGGRRAPAAHARARGARHGPLPGRRRRPTPRRAPSPSACRGRAR